MGATPGRRRPAVLLGIPAGAAVVGAFSALLTNAASDDTRWPGVLEYFRLHPWPALLLSVAFLALVPVGLAAASRREGTPPGESDLRRDAARLADRVRRELDDELGNRSHRTLLRLPLEPHAVNQGGRRLAELGDLTPIAGAVGRLVVVGPPGSGKSTALLKLTEELLIDRTEDALVPVPVNLSTWDPRTERLSDVIRRRVTGRGAGRPQRRRLFRARRRRAPAEPEDLVGTGRVLPILDGLDEIPRERWEDARRGLAVALGGRDQVFVIACAESVFLEIVPAALLTQGRTHVAEIRPVTVESAKDYLLGGDALRTGRWGPVFAALDRRDGGPLAEALSSPLSLYLARKVYERPSSDPGELATRFDSREAVEAHLLASYVPAAYLTPERSGDLATESPLRFPADRAPGWLGGIARILNRQETTALRWWRLGAPGADPKRLASRWSWGGFWLGSLLFTLSGAASAALLGLMLMAGAWALERAAGWLPPRVAGLLPEPASEADRAGRDSLLHRLGELELTGPLAGFLTDAGTVRVLAVLAVVSGIVVSTWVTMEAPASEVMTTTSARAAVLADRRLTLLRAAGVTVVSGAVLLWLKEPIWGWVRGPALHTVAGLLPGRVNVDALVAGPFRGGSPWPGWAAAGLAVLAGLAIVPGSAWFRFRSRAAFLALRGHLPWALLAFLDDANARGVLRRSGTVYEFRHRLVHRYLADPRRAGAPLPRLVAAAHEHLARREWRAAAALLSDLVGLAPSLATDLAVVHERWAHRFRNPALAQWYFRHVDEAVRYRLKLVTEDVPGATGELFDLYARLLDARRGGLTGGFFRLALLNRAGAGWERLRRDALPEARQEAMARLEALVAAPDRSPIVRFGLLDLRLRLRRARAKAARDPSHPDSVLGWWTSLELSEVAARALLRAAAEGSHGAVQTAGLLAALSIEDFTGLPRWERFWLHAGFPEVGDLWRAVDQDRRPAVPELPVGATGRTVGVSGDTMRALRHLARLAASHGMNPVHPGAVGLALLSVPSGGALRILLAFSGLTDRELRRAMMDDVLQADLLIDE
ncbi:MAG TPA: hypothetical protein VGD67_15055 [Pseudonocardiaceae bacterium]